MLYGLLVTLFVITCFLLILLILIQQGKSSMGIGGMGGGAQMLFGGSGGQDIFQKTTWILGTIFMAGSLLLTIYKSRETKMSFVKQRMHYQMPNRSAQPMMPAETD